MYNYRVVKEYDMVQHALMVFEQLDEGVLHHATSIVTRDLKNEQLSLRLCSILQRKFHYLVGRATRAEIKCSNFHKRGPLVYSLVLFIAKGPRSWYSGLERLPCKGVRIPAATDLSRKNR